MCINLNPVPQPSCLWLSVLVPLVFLWHLWPPYWRQRLDFLTVYSAGRQLHMKEKCQRFQTKMKSNFKPDKIAQWTIKMLVYCTCEHGYTTDPRQSCYHAYLSSFFTSTALLTPLSFDYILLTRCWGLEASMSTCLRLRWNFSWSNENFILLVCFLILYLQYIMHITVSFFCFFHM